MGLASFNVLESRWHLLTEIVLVVLLLAAALVWPKSKAGGAFSRIESAVVALSGRPWLQAFLVGGLAIGHWPSGGPRARIRAAGSLRCRRIQHTASGADIRPEPAVHADPPAP